MKVQAKFPGIVKDFLPWNTHPVETVQWSKSLKGWNCHVAHREISLTQGSIAFQWRKNVSGKVQNSKILKPKAVGPKGWQCHVDTTQMNPEMS